MSRTIIPAAACCAALAAASLFGASIAQEPLVTLDELDASYAPGDRIVVTGTVATVIAGSEVQIKIERSDDIGRSLIGIAQLRVARDGTFGHILNTDKWLEGKHDISATYEGNISLRTFDVIDAGDGGGGAGGGIFTVEIGDGRTGDINYTIEGGTVRHMEIDQPNLDLTVDIDAELTGSISLSVPREYVDARTDGCGGGDEEFIVTVDGAPAVHTTSGDQLRREISIPFNAGESRIVIIGTCVIPEFGALAALVMAASAGAAVAASSRLRAPA